MLIVNAEVDGRPGMGVRIRGDRIDAVEDARGMRAEPGEEVVDARGRMLLPGLHDHHIHLLALAAAATSVACGPPAVRTRDQLVMALRAAARAAGPGQWVRGIGYHESVAGDLDRFALDEIAADVPIRVQHRSGAMWVLNSAGLAALAADRTGPEGEPAGDGTLPWDGRLFRQDAWLGRRIGAAPPDLAAVGARLASYGVTGVTDATVDLGPSQVETLRAAVAAGDLPQRLVLTGGPDLADPGHPRISLGPVKIILDDDSAARLPEITDRVRRARGKGRPVAVHCVTRVQLVLALTALAEAGGARPGDRVEHASVVPPDLVGPLAAAGLTVVTQPHFIAERGDQYRADVDPEDLPWLYRCRRLAEAGIPVAAGTDAPFGDADPWASMRAAVRRRTPSGHLLGPGERLTPAQALRLYLGDPAAPGGPARRLAPGAPADLCLLAVPGRELLAEPLGLDGLDGAGGLDAAAVALTVAAGAVVHSAS